MNKVKNTNTDPFWYQKANAFTVGATSEEANPTLGIKRIETFENALTMADSDLGIVRRGVLHTFLGEIPFKVLESRRDKGACYVPPVGYIVLSPAVRAQILRYHEANPLAKVI